MYEPETIPYITHVLIPLGAALSVGIFLSFCVGLVTANESLLPEPELVHLRAKEAP